MTRRRWEQLLWAAALGLSLAGWVRWRSALPETDRASRPSLAAPPPLRAAAPARLGTASEVVARGNPFRLDRSPAPLGSPAPGQLGMMMATGYPAYVPPGSPAGYPAYTPPGIPQTAGALRVTGISGPSRWTCTWCRTPRARGYWTLPGRKRPHAPRGGTWGRRWNTTPTAASPR